MQENKIVQTIEVNNKETITLLTDSFEVRYKKKFRKKKVTYKYNEIENLTLYMSDPGKYLETVGVFATLNIKIKKKGVFGFDFKEFDVRNIKHQNAVVIAFVGSFKASIDANLGLDTKKQEPVIEILEPEVLTYNHKPNPKLLTTRTILGAKLLTQNKKLEENLITYNDKD